MSASALAHLDAGETTLLGLANDDPRDFVSLSERERLILRLYSQVQEQRLEKAFLEQADEEFSTADAEEQLAAAEREFLETRATYTARQKAVAAVLMTDPTLKAVHGQATSPPERALLGLLNRRDVLSLAYENLAAAHGDTLRALSETEMENSRLNERNQQLTQELLGLVQSDGAWREAVKKNELQLQQLQQPLEQLEQLEREERRASAQWEVIKAVCSAIVVGSGVDWSEELCGLVLE